MKEFGPVLYTTPHCKPSKITVDNKVLLRISSMYKQASNRGDYTNEITRHDVHIFICSNCRCTGIFPANSAPFQSGANNRPNTWCHVSGRHSWCQTRWIKFTSVHITCSDWHTITDRWEGWNRPINRSWRGIHS